MYRNCFLCKVLNTRGSHLGFCQTGVTSVVGRRTFSHSCSVPHGTLSSYLRPMACIFYYITFLPLLYRWTGPMSGRFIDFFSCRYEENVFAQISYLFWWVWPSFGWNVNLDIWHPVRRVHYRNYDTNFPYESLYFPQKVRTEIFPGPRGKMTISPNANIHL